MTRHMTKQLLDSTRRHFFQEAFGKAAGFGIGSSALLGLLGENLSAQSAPNHILDLDRKSVV